MLPTAILTSSRLSYTVPHAPQEEIAPRAASCLPATQPRGDTGGNRVGPGRALVLVGVIVTSLGSLTMVALILRDMERHQPGFRTQMNLGVAAVFSSWVLLQSKYALFYARQYWQPATGPGNTAGAGGLDFADEPAPDYYSSSHMTLHHIEVVSLKSNLSVASVVSAKSFETGSKSSRSIRTSLGPYFDEGI